MQKIKFDPTVNVGNVLAVFVVIFSVFAFWIKIETTLATYEAQLNQLERSMYELKEELLWLRRNHYFPPRDQFPWPNPDTGLDCVWFFEAGSLPNPKPDYPKHLKNRPLQPNRLEIQKTTVVKFLNTA